MTQMFTLPEASEVAQFIRGTLDFFDMSDSAQGKLLDAFASEMPYGVMKARTGDPDAWIADKFDAMGTASATMWLHDRTEMVWP